MELFKKEAQIDFIGLRKITGVLSIVLSLIAIGCLFVKGLNFGLEFTGGMEMELHFEQPIAPEEVKKQLEQVGFKELRVQHYGSTKDIMIRTASANLNDNEKIHDKINTIFNQASQKVDIRRVEFVGSEVGARMLEQGAMAVLVAILATMIYIALRFEYRFAFSAAIALCHDALLVLGIFAILQVEFDLATLAAVLAVLGYSLNDTIVIFDRVRENFRKIRKGTTTQILNISINQTLSRTIMTSLLTLLVILALLFYGGESLFGFSLALTLGIVIGTYSSIYVAGAFALMLGLSRSDLLSKPKAEFEHLP